MEKMAFNHSGYSIRFYSLVFFLFSLYINNFLRKGEKKNSFGEFVFYFHIDAIEMIAFGNSK